MGKAISKCKMNTFRLTQDESDKLCEFLEDCGEFNFTWSSSDKVWNFTDESGDYIGFIKIEIDEELKAIKQKKYYNECLAASRV